MMLFVSSIVTLLDKLTVRQGGAGFSFNDSIRNAANQMKEAVLGTANTNASKLSGFNAVN